LDDIAQTINALSSRQKQILRLLSQNMQAKEIARALGISEHTVKTHLETIRKRLDVATSREAARLYVQNEAEITIPLEEGGAPRAMETVPEDVAKTDQSLGGPGASDATGRHFGVEAAKADTTGKNVPETLPSKTLPGNAKLFSDNMLITVSHRLKTMSALEWTLLMLAISITSALLVGGLVIGAISALQAFQLVGQAIR
jgi:DNA-binding CsgD family transcriptional regulator